MSDLREKLGCCPECKAVGEPEDHRHKPWCSRLRRRTWFICPNCGSERFGSARSPSQDDFDRLHCSGESISIVLAEPGQGLTVNVQRCGFVGPRPAVFLREPAPRSAELANAIYYKIFRIPSRPINPKLIAEIIRDFEER